jgi:hypothetical protein
VQGRALAHADEAMSTAGCSGPRSRAIVDDLDRQLLRLVAQHDAGVVVGALLDATAVHPGRSADEHLHSLARANGIDGGRVSERLEQVGLEKVAKRRPPRSSASSSRRRCSSPPVSRGRSAALARSAR